VTDPKTESTLITPVLKKFSKHLLHLLPSATITVSNTYVRSR